MSETPIVQLRKLMESHFDLNDIYALCFDLGDDYENLSGDTKRVKIISLIMSSQRRGRLDDLVDLAAQYRPNVSWPGVSRQIDSARRLPNYVHPYLLPANFTGREREREQLSQWLKRDPNPIFVLTAIGGMGKSSLTWYWLQNDVDKQNLDGLLWWSFYEKEASFTAFLNELLDYTSRGFFDPADYPSNYDKVKLLVNLLQQEENKDFLIVLDGFERILRAYASLGAAYQADEAADTSNDARACIDPSAVYFLKSLTVLRDVKVLITTRLMVHDLEDHSGNPMAGCSLTSLDALSSADALTFMRLQGIKGTDTEIQRACAAYGYHPLSLQLLSGKLIRSLRNPGDIVEAPRYNVHVDLVSRRHHVLEVAYEALLPNLQVLLSRIAAFRTPMDYDALAIFNEFDSEKDFDEALQELIERGLVFVDRQNHRFDLHPIVRAYAYDKLANREKTHSRLQNYFAPLAIKATQPQTLELLSPVAELYYHTVRAGHHDNAWKLYSERLRNPLYYYFGAYNDDTQLLNELLDSNTFLPYVQDIKAQIWIMLYLAMNYERTGDLLSSLEHAEQAVRLAKEAQKWPDIGASLVVQASTLHNLGQLRHAKESGLEAIEVFENRVLDANWLGISHRNYGYLLTYRGEYDEAALQLDLAEQAYSGPRDFTHGLCLLWLYRSAHAAQLEDWEKAIDTAQKGLNLAEKSHYSREMAEANYRLSVALIQSGETAKAEVLLQKALLECRRMRLIDLEPSVLLALAQIRLLHKETVEEAHELAQEALSQAKRHRYRLQQAEINNFMAIWTLQAQKNINVARSYAETAKRLAWCDGSEGAYKAALNKAEQFLQEVST